LTRLHGTDSLLVRGVLGRWCLGAQQLSGGGDLQGMIGEILLSGLIPACVFSNSVVGFDKVLPYD